EVGGDGLATFPGDELGELRRARRWSGLPLARGAVGSRWPGDVLRGARPVGLWMVTGLPAHQEGGRQGQGGDEQAEHRVLPAPGSRVLGHAAHLPSGARVGWVGGGSWRCVTISVIPDIRDGAAPNGWSGRR